MAKCWCGCGRNLGFFKQRIAVHARDITAVFPILEHAARTDSAAGSLLTSGDFLSRRILASAHGEPVPANAVPDLREIDQWRVAANRVVASVAHNDPAYIQRFLANASPDEQRLIRSMLL